MKRTGTILLALLTGCATVQVDPSVETEARAPLICKDKAQCDYYWQRAQVWIAQNSHYRIQSVTDTVISTFGPVRSDTRYAYQVVRVPKSDGSAQITIGGACDNIFGCSSDLFSDIVHFKRFVQQAQ